MRCKCGAMLTDYDTTRKTQIVLETGEPIEIYEDLCKECRRAVMEYEQEEFMGMPMSWHKMKEEE